MAIIVGNLANSILIDSAASIAFADAYHEKRGNTAWADLDDDIKEQLLTKAGDYIKATYGNVWARNIALSVAIPIVMAQVNAELALIARTTPLLTNITRGKKRVKVGPLEIEYDGTASTQTQFVMASRMITPLLLRQSGAMVRLTRC